MYLKIEEHLNAISSLIGKRIAFLGDSVTADTRSSYVTLIMDFLSNGIDATTIDVINSGVDSSSVYDAIDRIQDVLEMDPDIFIIFLGINDSKIIEFVNKALVDVDSFERSYSMLLDRIDSKRKRTVILLTLPPLLFEKIDKGNLLKEYWHWNFDDYLKYNNVIQRIGLQHDSIVADIYSEFVNYDGDLGKLYYDDGVHPNIYGHQIIANAVLKAIIMSL
jgi:lysophospholipase L1-like esterase